MMGTTPREPSELRARLVALGILKADAPLGPGDDLDPLAQAVEELRRRREELESARGALERERLGLRGLFELAPDAFLVTDALGRIESANPAASELLGVPVPLLAGRPLADFVEVEDRALLRGCLSRVARTQRVTPCEMRMRRPDGRTFPASARVAPSFGLGGEPAGWIWSIRDVARQKAQEARLRDSTAELDRRVLDRTADLEVEARAGEQLLLETHAAAVESGAIDLLPADLVHDLDAIVWTADAATGRYTFVSRGAETILGYPPGRWTADPDAFAASVHPEDREYVAGSRDRARCAAAPREIEYRMLAADGRAVWFRESVRAVRDEAGEPRELRGLMVNVGRRKKVERQLYASRRQLADDLRDMTYLHELSSRLAHSRELPALLGEVLEAVLGVQGGEVGVLRLLDRERGELVAATSVGFGDDELERYRRVPVGRGIAGLVAANREPVIIEDVREDPRFACYLGDSRRTGQRAIFCIPLFSGGGEVVGTITTCFLEPHRPSERQSHLVGLYAQLAGMLIERARALHDARQADRRKQEVLATLSHEMRGPLASLRLSARLLRQPDADPPARERARDAVDRQVDQLTRLVDDLLDASRISLGKLALERRRVDLAVAVARAVETVRPLVEASGHELTVAVPPDATTLEADPARLEQILTNLLTNAAKFTGPGGRIALSVGRDGGEVAIRVRDNGVGIPPDFLPRVFGLFEQAGAPTDRSRGGLGIGLPLVKTLAELHGGRVSASSAGPGLGSEFVVHLPVAPPESPEAPAPAAPGPESARPRSVLLVDDHADTAELLAGLLRLEGHRVSVAHDGPSAIEAVGRRQPDVALLDLGLPGMDGYLVATRLRERSPSIRLVALTGQADPSHRRRAFEVGFDDYLVKPVDLDALGRILAN